MFANTEKCFDTITLAVYLTWLGEKLSEFL